ncbi:hypothetical protein TSUD_80730 [Trifolium subterraneum]|uniref:Uncharacterized protein n=1 Tax=Trifolium subterraneum TaxID=3900 RepID=A0A2Z6LMB1_TRISU|nr:hypothetical protein TSUD_80730 [Trifolium subterraneum]
MFHSHRLSTAVSPVFVLTKSRRDVGWVRDDAIDSTRVAMPPWVSTVGLVLSGEPLCCPFRRARVRVRGLLGSWDHDRYQQIWKNWLVLCTTCSAHVWLVLFTIGIND